MLNEKYAQLNRLNTINDLDDRRIKEIKPLVPPQIVMEDVPLSESAHNTIREGREIAHNIVTGKDDRLLVIVGPCSIHDPKAALDYASLLKQYADSAKDDLHIIMRVYFEKPRTTVGWKGLINDPFLDGTFKINKGLTIARELLLRINELGVPAGCEFLDTISPQYIADLVSWGAIGARTTESQVHRELASGLSAPVGFKNGTDGNVQVAIDAIKAAKESHHFLSVTKQGISAIVCTAGNDSCHVILRGGAKGPNFYKNTVKEITDKLKTSGVNPRIMVDCSHGNSQKDHKKQPLVADDIASQLADSSPDGTAANICGVMIESHIHEGRQNISDATGPCGRGLEYGKSITDSCINWENTKSVLEALRRGVVARRANKRTPMSSNIDNSIVDF